MAIVETQDHANEPVPREPSSMMLAFDTMK
jgi:hypothetical protein